MKTILISARQGEGAIFKETIGNNLIRNFYTDIVWKDCEYFDLCTTVKNTKLKVGDWVTDGDELFQVEFNSSTGYSVMRNNVGYGDYDYHTLKDTFQKVINSSNKHLKMEGYKNKFIEDFCENENLTVR